MKSRKQLSIVRVAVLAMMLAFGLSQRLTLSAANLVKYPGGKCYMYRLYLTDKNGSPYSLQHPEKFLSAKALQRRQRQHLAIDSTDLPVNPSYMERVSEDGVEIVCSSRWNNTIVVRGKNQRQLRALANLPFVSKAVKVFTSPDSVSKSVRQHFRHELNSWGEQSGNEYGATEEQVALLNGISLHQSGYRGNGLTIAVFDCGFMNADVIPVLARVSLKGTRDFVVPASKDIYKESDHGTMVLSVMAAREPYYFMGTAPEANYWLLRCEDTQSENPVEEDYWAAAAEFADSVGVDVINSSLGFHSFDDKTLDHSYAELDGEQTLISHTASMLMGKGIVLVNSAGNDGMGTWKKVNFPADASNIITVGAISPNGKNAAFSAVGPTADRRIKPDVMALGSPTGVITGRGSISRDMGTSFAAPTVTGLVACLWQAFPQATAHDIIQAVVASGNRYQTPDDVYGYGVPDFMRAYELLKAK